MSTSTLLYLCYVARTVTDSPPGLLRQQLCLAPLLVLQRYFTAMFVDDRMSLFRREGSLFVAVGVNAKCLGRMIGLGGRWRLFWSCIDMHVFVFIFIF